MIYEMRTYSFLPGDIPEFEQAVGLAMPHREKYSKMTAFWKTDIGDVNQIIHVWPYEDLEHRERVREELENDPNWPPKYSVKKTSARVDILNPAPFMTPHIGVKEHLGNIYEMRSYMLKPGSISEMIKRWSVAVPAREKYSPLAACWYSDLGPQFKWIHVWAYENFAARDRVRAEALKDPLWPPDTEEFMVRQENMILVPGSFSPLH